ncbi:MAG: hypothetical protein ACM339_06460 [Ignavibacteria bacterium]
MKDLSRLDFNAAYDASPASWLLHCESKRKDIGNAAGPFYIFSHSNNPCTLNSIAISNYISS